MNLTSEQRQVGEHNFYTAVGQTRRDFLKHSALAAVATGTSLGAAYYGYGQTLGDQLRVGIIGTGDEGSVLIGALNPDFIQVTAIADIRPYNVWRAFHGDHSSDNAYQARPGLNNIYGWKNQEEAEKHVNVYRKSYEELLEDENVEAVIIALPLHLHQEAAVAAMRAGKHVLTEKLMGHTVGQCKEMSRVAKETDLLLATGHQRHYNVLYDNAVQMIKRDLIGDIHYIRAQWHRGNLPGRDSWQPPLPCKLMPEAKYLDLRRSARKEGRESEIRAEYKLLEQLHSLEKKLKSKKYSASDLEKLAMRLEQTKQQMRDIEVEAGDYGYQEKTLPNGETRTPLAELIRWRLWDRTGAGLMAELGSHQLDAASIFISSQRDDGQKVLPLSVIGVGGRHIFPADRDVDDHVYCSFEFPGKGYYHDAASGEIADPNKKIVVTYSSINGNGFGGYGEVVHGTDGTLILEKEKDVMLYSGSNTSSRVTVKESKGAATLDTTDSWSGDLATAAEAKTAMGPVSRGYREEIEHWAWCIRNRAPENQPKCHPKVALADAVIALTSNLAMAKNERVEFKPEWFDIDHDATPEEIPPRPLSELDRA